MVYEFSIDVNRPLYGEEQAQFNIFTGICAPAGNLSAIIMRDYKYGHRRIGVMTMAISGGKLSAQKLHFYIIQSSRQIGHIASNVHNYFREDRQEYYSCVGILEPIRDENVASVVNAFSDNLMGAV